MDEWKPLFYGVAGALVLATLMVEKGADVNAVGKGLYSSTYAAQLTPLCPGNHRQLPHLLPRRCSS